MAEGEALEIGGSALVPLSEREFAAWQKERGIQVNCHRGRYWQKTSFGYFQPIHLLARLKPEEATRPSALSWGFRASLADEARGQANGSVPVYLLSDLAAYDIQSLPAKRRSDLRKCMKLVRIVRLKGMAVPGEEIYAAAVSSAKRTGYWSPPPIQDFLAKIKRDFSDGRRYVIAGLVDGKLAGYLDGVAVDGTAYVQSVIIATEYLPTSVGTGLIFEFAQACRRTDGVREIVYGLHSREDAKLTAFKTGMGFPVVMVPARVSVNPLFAGFIKRRYPAKYYRMTGIGAALRTDNARLQLRKRAGLW